MSASLVSPRAVLVMDVSNLPAAADAAAWGRWLGADEIAACSERARPRIHLAARLLAKRAVLALLEWRGSGGERDIEVIGGGPAHTRPRVELGAEVGRWGARRGVETVDVSLSHTAQFAGAMAIARYRESSAATTPAVCGLDLLDRQRWRRALRRGGDGVVARVTAPADRAADMRQRASSHRRSAARFALKECVVKALGGFPPGRGFHDVEVAFDDRGRPRVRCMGAVAQEASLAEAAPGLLLATVVVNAEASA